MGRGATLNRSASFLYGSRLKVLREARFVEVGGLQLPGPKARPRNGLDAFIVIGSLADNVVDDSSAQMFDHLSRATLSRLRHVTYTADHRATSTDLGRDHVIDEFERFKAGDHSLPRWGLDEIQWDICLHALHSAWELGGFRDQSIGAHPTTAEEIADTYAALCGTGIEHRGDAVLCAACRRQMPYAAVSDEAWREGFGTCGYLCGGAQCFTERTAAAEA